jgi:hypothetical protein
MHSFSVEAVTLTKARLLRDTQHIGTGYNPIGYDISAERNVADHRSGVFERVFSGKQTSLDREKTERLSAKRDS